MQIVRVHWDKCYGMCEQYAVETEREKKKISLEKTEDFQRWGDMYKSWAILDEKEMTKSGTEIKTQGIA